MQWWLLKRRLRFRLNSMQKKAISGKIPMTKELFLSCIDTLFQRNEREKFWQVWNKYPEYVQELYNEYENDIADPNSHQRKEADAWLADIKPKLAKVLGEDWV